ncbi:hypothetical protein K491DRAFT_697500 [Lophiostoma macrostomum CBS 122681]|uniref:ATP-dependent DNA helicase n=1 Tax=Lophiostoma macrostomum CBS 122681 TaxID=1314788 RepID=A0A6A6SQV5_9PLEO|nr:hypothetical protein K491DRAFT_697500 [Lophiostoma macrostomum CBS 122681]
MSNRNAAKRALDGPAGEANKRQKQEAVCATEEPHPHECAVSPPPGKKNYRHYAILGGPNPGVHYTVWGVAHKWIERFRVKQQAFDDAVSAAEWYQKEKPGFADLAPDRSQPRPQQPVAPALDLDADFIPLQTEKASLQRSAPPPSGPPLSPEQTNLVHLIVDQGKNVFYTGSAGVGESRVLEAFRQHLVSKGRQVYVTAPTGRAALDINGSTTWSYAGWKPDDMGKSLKFLKQNAYEKTTRKRLRNTDVLVIDEISMVENLFLERGST